MTTHQTTKPTLRRLLLVAVPIAWIAVALLHPDLHPEDAIGTVGDRLDMWITVHVVQLFLAAGLATVLWTVLRGQTSRAATVARAALPIWLVTFAAFDSVTGLASGLAAHHGEPTTGAHYDAINDTAGYLNSNAIAGNLSPIAGLATLSLIIAVGSTALALHRAGARARTSVAMLAGTLLAVHSGPPAALGLAAIAFAVWDADRDGLIARSSSSTAVEPAVHVAT
jgi:hypothetical protein